MVGTQGFVAFVPIAFAYQYILLDIFLKAMHAHFSKLKNAKDQKSFLPPFRSIHYWPFGGDLLGLCMCIFIFIFYSVMFVTI